MTEPDRVANGQVVTLRYRLTGEDGKLLDDSGDEGMDYLHGAENIVPGLEKALADHVVGDKLSVVVQPDEGYGRRVGAPQRVPRDSFPDDVELEPGMQFVAEDAKGRPVPVWVVAVTQAEVEIDANHPLAGAVLKFDVEVVAIRPATSDEIAHGHPHGPDGHHHH